MAMTSESIDGYDKLIAFVWNGYKIDWVHGVRLYLLAYVADMRDEPAIVCCSNAFTVVKAKALRTNLVSRTDCIRVRSQKLQDHVFHWSKASPFAVALYFMLTRIKPDGTNREDSAHRQTKASFLWVIS